MLRELYKLRIRSKLLAIMLLIGLVPVLVLGIFTYVSSQGAIRQQIDATSDLFIDMVEREVDGWFSQLRSDAVVLSLTSDIYQSLLVLYAAGGDQDSSIWRERLPMLDRISQAVVNEYDNYSTFFITDPWGRVVVASDERIAHQDLSGHQYVQDSLAGRVNFSDLFYSDAIEENCIVISTPVFSGGDRGAVVGTMNFVTGVSHLERAVQTGLQRLGESGNAYLIREDGVLLTNTRLGTLIEDAVLTERIETRAFELLESAIVQGDREFNARREYRDYDNNQVLGSMTVVPFGDGHAGLIIEFSAAEVLASVARMRHTIMAVICIAVLLIIMVGWVFSTTLSRPLVATATMLQDIAQGEGDLTRTLEVEAADEVGDVARWFNLFVAKLRDTILNVSSVSQEVATASSSLAESSQQMGESSSQVATAVAEVAANASDQGRLTGEVSQGVDAFNQTVEGLLGGVDAQSRASGEVLEAVVDMSQRLDEALLAIKSTEELLNGTAQAATSGHESVGKIADGMDLIQNTFSQVATTVRQLGQRSEEISGIVQAIGSIAEQTNLLALNAAIEAARAGVHGRGFAVVADEVRTLAENSARSTRDIADLIKSINRDIEEAVRGIEFGASEITNGVQLAGSGQQVLNDITTQVDQTQGEMVKLTQASDALRKTYDVTIRGIENIAGVVESNRKATTDMSEQSEKMTRHITSIASASEETAATAEEVSAASEEQHGSVEEMITMTENLAEVARKLQEVVNQFRV